MDGSKYTIGRNDKMATTNYKLEEINKATDVLSPDPINRNMVKIDTQMKASEDKIKAVEQQVATIDVTTDVEEVVNRRVNSDRTKPLNTIVSDFKDVIVSAINTARDNIKAHVTSEHTNTKSNVNTSIVSARDSINTNVDQCETNLAAKIESLKQYVSSKKSGLAGAITDKGISTPANATFDTMIANINQVQNNVIWGDGTPVVTKGIIPTSEGQTVYSYSNANGGYAIIHMKETYGNRINFKIISDGAQVSGDWREDYDGGSSPNKYVRVISFNSSFSVVHDISYLTAEYEVYVYPNLKKYATVNHNNNVRLSFYEDGRVYTRDVATYNNPKGGHVTLSGIQYGTDNYNTTNWKVIVDGVELLTLDSAKSTLGSRPIRFNKSIQIQAVTNARDTSSGSISYYYCYWQHVLY